MAKKPEPSWRAPRLWPGETCFILGGGPSLKDIDVDRLTDRRVIAVNQAYRLGAWIDVLFFGDCRWYTCNEDALLHFAGLKVTTCAKHVDKPGIKVVGRRNAPPVGQGKSLVGGGLSKDPSVVVWNLSSGACAINLAVHFGVKRIVLLGFDMKKLGDDHNWHHDYPRSPSKKDPYTRFLKPFPRIASALKDLRVECVNACRNSELDVFPFVDLEDVL